MPSQADLRHLKHHVDLALADRANADVPDKATYMQSQITAAPIDAEPIQVWVISRLNLVDPSDGTRVNALAQDLLTHQATTTAMVNLDVVEAIEGTLAPEVVP